MENQLYHFGTPHVGATPHSGRYEWGSGDDPYQHGYSAERLDFLSRNDAYKKEGMSESEIANAFGLTVTEYRKQRSIALAEENAALRARAIRLRDHGYGATEIGRIMGYGESTVRNWIKPVEESRKDKYENVAGILEQKLKNGEMIDIGKGSELELGVNRTTFDTALNLLKEKGYVVDTIDIEQPNAPGKYTTIKYIAPEGTTKKDAWINRDNITTITEYSPNMGISFQKTMPPESISSDRVYVMYKDDGGIEKDGLIGIRPGVQDLSLGNSHYAQVRIAVDGKYYAKGMAIYDDSIPEGFDICVYSNKSTKFSDKKNGVEGALKELKADPDNPFGANIKQGAGGQTFYKDDKGKYVKDGDIYILASKNDKGDRYSLSAVNKIKEDEDWESYRKALPAQFLSKQPLQLIEHQLDLTYKNKVDEYNDILSLDNPVLKKKLLDDFAEAVDKNAKHLDAAALPRQTTKVIIPVPELKDNEIYAPTYKNGEKLALVRFPHAGPFEIPIVIVNNNNPAAKKAIGNNAIDAVGINKRVADRLSGADFDGDVVLTIPITDKVQIKSRSTLKDLEGFDPSERYPGYPGMKPITSKEKQKQMGIVTNLITDMSLRNYTDEEMARAVRHSMVVIDAEKHNLNWKLSEQDNAIDALKRKYQQNPDKKKGYGGSSTLLSRLGNATVKVDELQPVKVDKDGNPIIDKNGKYIKSYTADPNTGKWILRESGRTYDKAIKDKKTGEYKRDADGKLIFETKKYKSEVSPLDLVDDARKLISAMDTPQERAYADYINKMRALANEARKTSLNMATPKADPVAKSTYKDEVESLKAKLDIALKNKPLERQAQIKTSVKIEKLKNTNPEMFDTSKKDKLKKEKAKILTQTRLEVGSGKKQIDISEREWEAIQARAISPTTLKAIFDNADMDKVREYASPKNKLIFTEAKIQRIKALSNAGFTLKEISDELGYSTNTISKCLNNN